MSFRDASHGGVIRHRAPVRSRPSRLALVLGVAGVACALVAALTAADAQPPAPASWIWPPAPQLAADAPPATDPPTRLRIPRIGVDTSLEKLDVDRTGTLTPPVDYAKAGWYERGVVPGEPGPAVIAGHVDSYRGAAVFQRLGELRAGDSVEVEFDRHRVTFRVVSSGQYAKNRFPSETVYAPTPVPELRLITCGGQFDENHGSYHDNIIVFAILTNGSI